jgi:hypothetical protein
MRKQTRQLQPGELWLDDNGIHINAHGGGILFHEGTYYWYGEHKIEGEAGNKAMVGVHVYSSKNLYDWKDMGVALEVSDDPQSEITQGCILERPKVIFCEKTNKFVMWFHLEHLGTDYQTARSGIAVSDSPTRNFQFLSSVRPNVGFYPQNIPDAWKKPLTDQEAENLEKLNIGGGSVPYYPKDLIFRRDFANGQMARDMTLFVDEDGIAYHIYSSESNGTLHIAELTDDYLAHTGKFIRIMPGRYNEAPAMMKHNGRYFIFASDCTGWSPNTMRLFVSDSIFGEWEEVGNPCQGTGAQVANSFESQPTFILPAQGTEGSFVYMGDRWRPKNAIDGRYIWLPIQFRHGFPVIEWFDEWDLTFFN